MTREACSSTTFSVLPRPPRRYQLFSAVPHLPSATDLHSQQTLAWVACKLMIFIHACIILTPLQARAYYYNQEGLHNLRTKLCMSQPDPALATTFAHLDVTLCCCRTPLLSLVFNLPMAAIDPLESKPHMLDS